MSEDTITKGSCICGATRYETKGRPIRSGYCHCTSCQRLNGGAFVHAMHWAPEQFTWTHGDNPEEALDTWSNPASKPWKKRYRCKKCGISIAGFHERANRWGTWGAHVDREDSDSGKFKNWDVIKPTHHMFYDTRVLDVRDGLPKWKTYENESDRLVE